MSSKIERLYGNSKEHRLRCRDGAQITLTKYIRLSFDTSAKRSEDQIFEIFEGHSYGDGESRFNHVLDLTFGAPWLTGNLVLMMDPTFSRDTHAVLYEVSEPRLIVDNDDSFRVMPDKIYRPGQRTLEVAVRSTSSIR